MKRTIRADDSVLVYLLAFAFYQAAGVIVSMTVDSATDGYIFLSFAIPQICYILTAVIYSLTRKVSLNILQKENVKLSHYPLAIALGLGLFFFALLPNYGLQILFSLVGKNPTVTVPSMDSPLNISMGILIICVLPAIGEELVFRKIFVDGFSEYGEVTAVILSGVFFGLSHLNLAQTVHQIFLGILLAYLYVKTKNITLTVIIHFLNNLLALFLPVVTGEAIWSELSVLGISCAVGGILLIGSIIYLVKTTKKIDKTMKKPSLFTIGLGVILLVLWIIMAIVS